MKEKILRSLLLILSLTLRANTQGDTSASVGGGDGGGGGGGGGTTQPPPNLLSSDPPMRCETYNIFGCDL